MCTPLWSISVICKNEEQSILNMIGSLKEYISLGGEIVVIDTGSTDKTISVLESVGFKKDDSGNKLRYEEVGDLFTFDIDSSLEKINNKFVSSCDKLFEPSGKKVFDFGAARRYAGSKCSNDWVLSVDCDEVFSALNIAFLNNIIKTNTVQQISFVFRYKGSDGTNHSVTSRDKFYNRKFGDWKWVVHEQVKPLLGKKVNMMSVSEHILALDHFQHPAEHRNNYLLSMCIDVMEDENDQHLFWLGREMCFTGYYFSAIAILKEYLDKYTTAWSAERCMAALYIGDSYINLSKKFESEYSWISLSEGTKRIHEYEMSGLSWYFKGVLYEKNFREPWMKLANFHYSKKEFFLASQFISVALKIKKVAQNYMNDGSCYGSDPNVKLYISLYANGDKEKAHKVWKKTCLQFPSEQNIKDHSYLFNSQIRT